MNNKSQDVKVTFTKIPGGKMQQAYGLKTLNCPPNKRNGFILNKNYVATLNNG